MCLYYVYDVFMDLKDCLETPSLKSVYKGYVCEQNIEVMVRPDPC